MEWVNNFIRIPFAEKGRSREGADCWGLIRIIFKEQLGIELRTLLDYVHTKDKMNVTECIESEAARWVEIPIGQEKPYDVAVFTMLGYPMHVGLVVEPNFMIHTERGSGTCFTNYNKEQQWFRRLVGFYRYDECSDSPAAI